MQKRSILVPSISEMLSYAFLSFTIISLTQYDNFFRFLAGRELQQGEVSSLFSEAFRVRMEEFFTLLDSNALTASISLALFWAVIGVFVYIGVNLAQRFFIEAEEDLLSEAAYVHPSSYSHFYFWVHFVARVIFRSAMLVAIGLYVFYLGQVLIPFWIETIEAWILEPLSLNRASFGALAFLGFMLSWHVIPVLSRLLFMRNRVFGDG